MKKTIKALAVALLGLTLATTGVRASIDIPDGNPVGVVSTISLGGIALPISSIAVTLNVSGGNNGDLYAYLSYGGNLVTLLNRPGVSGGNLLGYTDPGFNNATFSDLGAAYTGAGGVAASGSYSSPDGAAAFTTAYGGANPNGVWTLFIADLSGGDPADSQLVSWFLTINGTTVPEPTTWALILFAVSSLSLLLLRHWRRRACPAA